MRATPPMPTTRASAASSRWRSVPRTATSPSPPTTSSPTPRLFTASTSRWP